MKLAVFLNTVLFVVLVNYTAAAQEVLKVEADSIPVLEEWWRAPLPPELPGNQFLGEGLTFLPNFYNGHNAMALRSFNGEIHTWLNRFPGDTQNVFTWKAAYIKQGDFNGDGITDYIDAIGNIYRGIQNGQPPENEPIVKYEGAIGIYDFNNDGYDDIATASGRIIYGASDFLNLIIKPDGQGLFSGNLSTFYKTQQGDFRFIIRNNRVKSFDGYALYSAAWTQGGMTPKFERLDSISRSLFGQQEYFYVGGGQALYQSKFHDKTYFFAIEKIDNIFLKNNIVIFDVTNNKFDKLLRFRMDTASIYFFEHSIDGDKYEDWWFISRLGEVNIMSGNVTLDSVIKIKTGCPGINTGAYSIGDVSGDGISDIALVGKRWEESCFKIMKGKDLTTSIKNENTQQNFSLKTFKTTPSHFTISFTLVKESHATFSLFDMEGKLVRVVKEGMFDAGEQSFVWDSGDMPQGAYLLQLTAEGQTQTEKILIMR